MLLERFLVGDRVEEKLAAFLVVLAAAVVAAVLGHVLAPLFIELGELIELFLEIVVVLARLFFRSGFGGLLFENRVGLQFLLHDVAQFQHRSLEDD
jgi:hypothetical protein